MSVLLSHSSTPPPFSHHRSLRFICFHVVAVHNLYILFCTVFNFLYFYLYLIFCFMENNKLPTWLWLYFFFPFGEPSGVGRYFFSSPISPVGCLKENIPRKVKWILLVLSSIYYSELSYIFPLLLFSPWLSCAVFFFLLCWDFDLLLCIPPRIKSCC